MAADTCAGQTEAAAVILGAWLSELGSAAEVRATRSPPRSPLSPSGIRVPSVSAGDSGLEFRVQLGLAASARRLKSSLSLTAAPQLLTRLRWHRFELQVGGWLETRESVELPPGRASWTRAGLSSGLAYRVNRGPVAVDVGLRFERLWVSSRGEGFGQNFFGSRIQLALTPHLRVEWAFAERWSLVAEPAVRGILTPLTFRVEGAPEARTLPSMEVGLALALGHTIF